MNEVEAEKLRRKNIKFEHECKMEFARYVRETERLKHEWKLEETRIKTAEIRRTQLRRQR